ncbi:MAG: hypothetical protein A2X46_11720 [Lentisphaerae bacterium GWF2_57_35]|nr:MAG: hypothetical protein A2X46_11720 [Lentisphaerae bacterium GWF2_57_35]
MLAIVLVSGCIGTYFYFSAVGSLMNSIQSRLKNSAALVSQALDAQDFAEIRQAGDTNRPAYRQAVEKLRALQKTNPDIAFLYIMRRDGDQVSFVADSDESGDQAVPGQIYQHVVPALLEGFAYPAVDNRICKDDWGYFMSGYAPIQHGEERFLVGLDMRANEVRAKFHALRMSGLMSLFISILLAMAFSRGLSRHFVSPIRSLIRRCQDIASGRLNDQVELKTGDELEQLIDAFNAMSNDLARARSIQRATQESLKRARDDLEVRVRQRTHDLQEANDRLVREVKERTALQEAREKTLADLQEALANVKLLHGLLPICAHCKKIRDDQGYWRQVEEYMSRHSDVRFSHSICPDCEKHVYYLAGLPNP